MNFTFTKTKKYVVLALFLVAAILSLVFMGKVAINYNISDYLDDSTETKISLGILNEEFGATGNIQVMIENIDTDTAAEVRDILAAIPNVLTVSFDPYSENSYKDGKALFVILTDGDEYSASGAAVAEDVKAALDAKFEGKIHYGGAIIEKAKLRQAIEGEIPFILVISVCLAIAIMLLTSKSWFEPLILLAASGVAILINMGTNALLGEISYITNAVSAILQLALSIDYSIMLLHSYRSAKLTENDRGVAMGMAIKKVASPVSASALTTMAGLFALLFMSFKIGFDIGIVLMKGILIAAITSLTLLPAFLVMFDKLMSKTEKKELVFKGKKFCGFAFRAKTFVVPVALVLVVACAFLQAKNIYSFTDKKSGNAAISEAFGQNSTIVLLYPHSDSNHANEQALAERLKDYKTLSGNHVLKSYTAYSNTVRELYDMEKAVRKLNLPEKDVELLLTMYHIYGEPSLVELSIVDFLKYTDQLLTEDPDAQGLANEGMQKAVQLMLLLQEIMQSEYTAEEFHAVITEQLPEGIELDPMLIEQIYGLYFYDGVEDQKINFMTMFDFLVEIAQRDRFAALIGEEKVAQIVSLSENIKAVKTMIETPLTYEEFSAMAAEKFDMNLEPFLTWMLYLSYHTSQTGAVIDRNAPLPPIAPIDLLRYIAVDSPSLIQQYLTPEIKEKLTVCIELYDALGKSYAYDELIPLASRIAEGLDIEGEFGIEIPELDGYDLILQQAYILYFYEQDTMPEGSIPCKALLDFLIETAESNALISRYLTDDIRAAIGDLYTVDEFLRNTVKFDFAEMADQINGLKNAIKSISVDINIGKDMLSGIYIKYAIAGENGLTGAVEAIELLDFVIANMNTHELLKLKMTDANREKVLEAQEAVASGTDLFMSDNYARMLLSVDLPAESEESTAFVEYLTASVKEIFGEEAHVAGEMMSTYDLQKAFAKDNAFITIFTIISIFLIILVIFRSISLPVILVAIIQGAIWIAMATSLLTGPMFFMSYIVTTCILMGATIDYGILMSTNYVNNRTTMDKKEALRGAMAAAMPTIFTSGLILMICGFVIGFIASQNAISTVGILLGKGTLVSILMITLVLPSVLYLLDGFVLKLSMKRKGNAENEKPRA